MTQTEPQTLNILPSGSGKRGHARFDGSDHDRVQTSLIGRSGWRTRQHAVVDVGLGGLQVGVSNTEVQRMRVGSPCTASLVMFGQRIWLRGRIARIERRKSLFGPSWSVAMAFDCRPDMTTVLQLRSHLWRLPKAA